MKTRVQEALDVLVGQPLWSSGRAADLEWFQFGPRKTVKDSWGEKEVGEYALHVQCAWRIRRGDRVVVASRDLYSPPEENPEENPKENNDRPGNFHWDVQGGNRRDRRIAELFQNETRQFMVRKVEAGEAGGFTIVFEDEYALEVFPDDSMSGEHWRIFKPYADEPHFVVTGAGIED
jgi:hypothetical protein